MCRKTKQIRDDKMEHELIYIQQNARTRCFTPKQRVPCEEATSRTR